MSGQIRLILINKWKIFPRNSWFPVRKLAFLGNMMNAPYTYANIQIIAEKLFAGNGITRKPIVKMATLWFNNFFVKHPILFKF